jgi:hypothetical protein
VTSETDSFVHEVDESLRDERMVGFARRWGPYILGGFILIIVCVGAWQFWRGYTLNQGREQAEQYAAAQELARQGDLAGAKTEMARLREEGPRSYRVMARMQYAALLAIEGDLEGALTENDAAAEAANDPIMRQSAQLRAAFIAAETQDFDALQARLDPIIASGTRLAFPARELLAIEAWEAGQLDVARDALENLTLAFDAPEPVRQRAQVALSVIGPAPETATNGDDAAASSAGEQP